MEGANTARPTEADIVARARAMLPMLRQRAAETEALRRLPDATNREFAEAGFYKIMQPHRYGGYELRFGLQTELGAELGRACGSAAWVASITSCHPWLAGMFPPEAQDEIWGESAETTVSSSFMAVAPKVERTQGGYRVSGRWKFSSGVDHCRWAVVMLPIPPKVFFALLRLSECRVEDTWRAVGLAGTGSNDIVADSVFLPDRRLLDLDDVKGGPTPGSAVNDHYLYRLPVLAPLTFSIVGNALGVARGIAETIVEQLQVQKSRAGTPVAANQSIQLRVAEAQAEIDAAHALVFKDRDEIVRKGLAGETITLADRVRYRRDMSFSGQLCVRAVERLFPIVGAQGLMSDHPVQRGWRDLRAISHHLAMTWDIQGSLYGAVTLGLPCPDPKI
ncbi:MAG TPA: acyl-CoA dehydrogenase family protein [Stellaceae bacterium]|nr:acyl-CoA dehydrogenase family protein [Stellaceae bacterium]